MKKIFFLFLTIFFVGCDNEVSENNTDSLQNTLSQDLQGYAGSYEDYFFQLDKKLNISYRTNYNPEYNNSDTLNLQTFPEYLLYLASNSSGDSTLYMSEEIDDIESLLFNSESMEFEGVEISINNDTTLASTVVVSSPKHKDFKNYEWSYEYGRYIGSQDIDHQDCAQNASECISVTYTGEGAELGFEFDSTSNLIYVEDPIVFTKITSIIDSLEEDFYSYIDLSDYDTTITEICEPDSVVISADSVRIDCQAFKDTLIFEYEVGVLGLDSSMFLTEVGSSGEFIVGELPNNLLIDINGDTLTSFIPDQTYTLENGEIITPVVIQTYRDTVVKPYTDYMEKIMLLENHIIDEINDDSHTYNVMKSTVGWQNNGINMNSSGYFIYRNEDQFLYELIYPSYFNYYGGVWDGVNEEFIDNGWTSHADNRDSVLFYLPFRDGEVVEHEYTIFFDDSYNDSGEFTGNSAEYFITSYYDVKYHDSFEIENISINNELFDLKSFDNVFEVNKVGSMTMIGSGVKYTEKQTYWLAKNYGIIKQLIEYQWGDYEMVTAHEWTMQRYNESDSSSPVVLNSLDELANQFGEDRFIPKKSSGIVKFAPKYK